LVPSGRAERADLGDGALGQDLHAGALGEVEVVLRQRVLGVVAAADHAGAAADAAGARRAVAAEVGVGHGPAGLAEEHADAGRRVGLRHAPLLGELAQQRVGGPLALVLGDAEHLLGGLVVGRERRRPVLELAPLRIAVEGGALGGPVERVGVAEAATADAAAGDDEDVLEERHAEDPAEAEARQPVVAARVPGRLCEVLVAVAAARLEDGDLVALLGESERADAAAEARADDDPVVVVLRHGARS
jgi:hypothetical protein